MRSNRWSVATLALCAPLALGSVAISHWARQPAQGRLQNHVVTHPLSNSDVLEMLKAGLAAEVVVAKIKTAPCDFDTSPASLASLKTAGVPTSVIVAMVDAPVTTPESFAESSRPRVYVTDSQSWSVAGWEESHGSISTDGSGRVTGSSSGSGFTRGGARPQTAEIIKTLNQRCPEVIVTDIAAKADYALLLDHEGGKGLLRHKDKVAVFDKAGDGIFSASTLTLGGSVEGACQAIEGDLTKKRRPD